MSPKEILDTKIIKEGSLVTIIQWVRGWYFGEGDSIIGLQGEETMIIDRKVIPVGTFVVSNPSGALKPEETSPDPTPEET